LVNDHEMMKYQTNKVKTASQMCQNQQKSI